MDQNKSALNISGLEYIEMYVANIVHSLHFFKTVMNFKLIGSSELSINKTDRISYLLQQGNIKLILTSALTPKSPVAEFVFQHGDSIKDIAFATSNLDADYNNLLLNGACSALEPISIVVGQEEILKASIHAFGDTVHSLIQKQKYTECYSPIQNENELLSDIDHIAVCVEENTLDFWVSFYKNTLGFYESHQENIRTEYSGMNSKVVRNSAGTIIFTIVEPQKGKKRSQVEEYLHYHEGAGVQHIAFLSADILKATQYFRKNGLDFLKIPNTYYDELKAHMSLSKKDMDDLKELQILLDHDSNGYLLQIFSRPIHSRPTFFIEIIQRNGIDGFGSANIKALFQAIEREQLVREPI